MKFQPVQYLRLFTGILQVNIYDTAPSPTSTIPLAGVGTNRTVSYMVCLSTHSTYSTCGSAYKNVSTSSSNDIVTTIAAAPAPAAAIATTFHAAALVAVPQPQPQLLLPLPSLLSPL